MAHVWEGRMQGGSYLASSSSSLTDKSSAPSRVFSAWKQRILVPQYRAACGTCTAAYPSLVPDSAQAIRTGMPYVSTGRQKPDRGPGQRIGKTCGAYLGLLWWW
eukprot:2978120-Rhodomonas_salina.1